MLLYMTETNKSQMDMELLNKELQKLQTEKYLSECKALKVLVGIYGPKEIARFLNWLGEKDKNTD